MEIIKGMMICVSLQSLAFVSMKKAAKGNILLNYVKAFQDAKILLKLYFSF